jgi:hypothetical protein
MCTIITSLAPEIEHLNRMREQARVFREQAERVATDTVQLGFQALFTRYPKLESVSWNHYGPGQLTPKAEYLGKVLLIRYDGDVLKTNEPRADVDIHKLTCEVKAVINIMTIREITSTFGENKTIHFTRGKIQTFDLFDE